MSETITAPATRERRPTRSQVHLKPLTPAQARYVEKARRETLGILLSTDVSSWLVLRAIVDKGHATVIERDGGRPAGKILAVRVREAS